MNRLEVAELAPPSLIQRLFRRKSRENGLAVIGDIVANTPIPQITPEFIATMLR